MVKGLTKKRTLGLDGFMAEFYQATWSFIGRDIWELLEESRRSRQAYPTLNSTLIYLIPKQENFDEPSSFRTIALCNVIYKILSMIMVNRLKPILPSLISPK